MQGLAVASLLAVLAGVAGWSLVHGMKRMFQEWPQEAVDTQGDALSALLVVRSVARTAGSPDQPDDQIPGESPPPPEPGIDRLRAEISARAMDDWRVLEMLSDPHPTDPPLPADAVRDRLLALAGDNAHVHMTLLGRSSDCCRRGIPAADVLAAMNATRYESPMTAHIASLEDRFRRVPARRFSVVMPEAVYLPMAAQVAFMQVFLSGSSLPGPAFERACEDASGDVLEACRHLANLAVRDADWSLEALGAIDLIERIGTDAQRSLASERSREITWLSLNSRRLLEEEDVPNEDEAFRFALFGDLAAMRGVLGQNGIDVVPPPDWKPPGDSP